jgi:hypothetical protein
MARSSSACSSPVPSLMQRLCNCSASCGAAKRVAAPTRSAPSSQCRYPVRSATAVLERAAHGSIGEEPGVDPDGRRRGLRASRSGVAGEPRTAESRPLPRG